MKTKNIVKTFVLFIVVATAFSCEPESDNNNNGNTSSNLPITLNLAGLGYTQNNYNFDIQGYSFTNEGGASADPDTGIGLFGDAYLELDLSSSAGEISTITLDIMSYCPHCNEIQILDAEGNIVGGLSAGEVPEQEGILVLDDIDPMAHSLKIIGQELVVASITLE